MTPVVYGCVSAVSFGVLTSLQLRDIARRGKGGPGHNVWGQLLLRVLVGAVWLVSSYLALPLVGGEIVDIWKLALLCWVPIAALEVISPRRTSQEPDPL